MTEIASTTSFTATVFSSALRHTAHSCYFQSSSQACMIRSYKGVNPTIPATCFVDESAQIIGDVVLGEHASIWMNAVMRGDVHEIRIGAHPTCRTTACSMA